MLSRACCVFVVFAAACGGETESEARERCQPAAEGVIVLDGPGEIEQARNLVTVDGDLIVCNFSGDIILPSLRVVEGSLSFLTTWEGSVTLPSLIRTGGEIITSINLVVPRLEASAGISSSGFATGTMSLPSLTRVGELWYRGPVEAPNLLAADRVFVGPLVAPKLERFNHATLAPFGHSELPSLDNFISADLELSDSPAAAVFPAVREVGAITFLTDSNLPERIEMPALETASHLAFVGLAGLTSIDFPLLTSLRTMDVVRTPGAYCELRALADETGAQLNSVRNDAAEPCN